MKLRFVSLWLCALSLAAPVWAQDGGAGARGGFGMGLTGTVTAVAEGSFTIQTYFGQSYTVRYDAQTRFLKQAIDERSRPGREGDSAGGPPPERAKPESIDSKAIKPGVDISVMGATGAATKIATAIVLVDPERARQMRERMAGYGKSWVMGKVASIDGLKIVLTGSADGVSYVLVLDENTSLRKRREPATLDEIAVGDLLRAEGKAVAAGFAATTINVMGAPQGQLPRSDPPQLRDPQP